MKSTSDGKSLWRWSDWFSSRERLGNPSPFYADQDKVLYTTGLRTYLINSQSGTTIWRKEWGAGFSRNGYASSVINDLFFFVGTEENTYVTQKKQQENIFIATLSTGAIIDTVQIDYSGSEPYADPSGLTIVGQIERIKPFVWQGKMYLFVSYGVYAKERNEFTSLARGRIGLLNVNDKKRLYKRDFSNLPGGANGANWPNIVNDRVYVTSNLSVACVDLWTGQDVWFQKLTQASLLNDLVVADGKVFANGNDARLYCLNPQTGQVLWTQKSSAIGSQLHYQDGVIYYIASKKLLAVEAATGKLLWDLPCPDAYTQDRPDSWFFGFVTGVPGKNGQKGRIIATTHLNVYCFEAAR